MGMPADFSVVISSLSTAASMARGFMSLKTEAERQQLVIDLQNKILEAQQFALEARDMESAMREDYQGALAEIIRLKDQAELLKSLVRREGLYFAPGDDDPLCPRCIEVDRKVIHLANPGTNAFKQRHWTCPQCEKLFKVGEAQPLPSLRPRAY
jgi:uncharacterized protein YbcI